MFIGIERSMLDLDILIDKIRKIKAIVKRLFVNDTKKLNSYDKNGKEQGNTNMISLKTA